ncbi:MAG: glycosyltransferase family 4 protein [Flavobacteriales bacterium]|nr:glycosyltransferase family 4 protein [Flavobacteriales bacterium]
MKKVLFLYSEISPYLMAGIDRLAIDHGVEVHIVRWPINPEAPFHFKQIPGVKVHERTAYDTAALRAFAKELRPDLIFASGWVDKAYLRVCRDARDRGVPTVMCSDPSWRGDLRQHVAVVAAKCWLPRTFSHAWVPGPPQAEYAARLGIRRANIKHGFYTADTERFVRMEKEYTAAKAVRFPHRFIFVARYIGLKGHQYTLSAFIELCEAGQAGDWEIWCIGTGELQGKVPEHPRVRHVGFVQSGDMGAYIGQCGVSILASMYEAWGVVVHEHAAAGLPLLLSDAVGARHRFLQEGRNGWSFKAGDKAALKEVFRMMMAKSDDELREMGRASAALGASWGPEQWAATVMDLIAEGHG